MNAPAIPAAKELVRSLTLRQAQEIAEKTLVISTAGDVRDYLQGLGLAQPQGSCAIKVLQAKLTTLGAQDTAARCDG